MRELGGGGTAATFLNKRLVPSPARAGEG
ncbi:hypothetical protein FZ938_11500 [Azospirillum oryzae]|nr:hypothetical protein FZ938_11500 [Azospirillum oryzae]